MAPSTVARIPRTCAFCGTTFWIRESELQRRRANFCSLSCSRRSRGAITVGHNRGVLLGRIDKEGPLPEHCPERGRCWEYQGPLEGKRYAPHRLAWEVFVGTEIGKHYLLHHCDNRRCVKADPDPAVSHIYLGDAKRNMEDMVARGRAKGGSPPGERAGKHKLTGGQVREIRAAWPEAQKAISLRAFAEKYGIRHPAMLKILSGKAWRHLT